MPIAPMLLNLRRPTAARLRRPLRPSRLLLAAFFALSCLFALTGPVQAIAYPSLFGTREVHSKHLTMFPKWRGVVERFHGEETSCPSGECDSKSWAAFLDKTRGLDRISQLEAVNTAMNEKRYIIDPINWGVPDYWATPFQFLRKQGDCEDYAVAKFMALRAMGIPNEDMRIVVLQDLNLRIAHAVLAVYVDGKALILDNQIRKVVPSTTIHHYQPFYSVNENGWWKHFP